MTTRPTRLDRWRARSGDGGKVAVAATGALMLLGVLFSIALVRTPVSLACLVWLVLAVTAFGLSAIAAALAYGFHSLTYQLGRNALVIRWLGQEERVAYSSIDAIYSGTRLGRLSSRFPINLRGYRVGLGWTKGAGTVRFYTTSDRGEDITVVAAEHAVYALTPDDPTAFRRELITRVEAADQAVGPAASPPTWLAAQTTLTGLPVAALGLAALILLGSSALIFNQYSALPDTLSLYVSRTGMAEPSASRAELFLLPGLGCLVLLLHLVTGVVVARAEPVLARLVWLSTPVVQAMLLISVLRVLP